MKKSVIDTDCLEYPRPQLVRSEFQKLNGKWQFSFDPHNKGLAENWQAQGKKKPGPSV
jgi:beta-galactosidase/beta-glucuronidase